MARRAPAREPAGEHSIHAAYAEHGTRGFYERFGADYRNPHEPVISDLIDKLLNEWPLDVSHVLDLAAGSGEVTMALQKHVARVSDPCSSPGHGLETRATAISAIDPYTSAAYEARVGRPCEAMTFEQIAAGALHGRTYSLLVCSFALHLAEPSRLPTLCWELAGVAGQLLILTPHKRPTIEMDWGWRLTHETIFQRVRARLYAVQPTPKGLS